MKKVLFVLITFFLFVTCKSINTTTVKSTPPSNDEQKLVILATNDVHGVMAPSLDADHIGGVANFSAIADATRVGVAATR